MSNDDQSILLWDRYKQHLCQCDEIGLSLDVSRMTFEDSWLASMNESMGAALRAMDELEKGAIANADENRRVGHYWLRDAKLAPDEALCSEIENTISVIKTFAGDIHNEKIKPQRGDGFYVVLVIGIGGSALGSQMLYHALSGPDDSMLVYFLDNTDPDGIDRVLQELDDTLAQTLTLVISKSGTTPETRNSMLEVARSYKTAGLDFAKHAVAITQNKSALHQQATKDNWLQILPMWDWVGGRTSVTSAVGLLPAALMGVDIDELLGGARDCDRITRGKDIQKNPAAMLALMWYYAGNGRGERSMVVLPYRDRLEWFARYLQQLVMESLGKKFDRSDQIVHQGLTVLGNKGTTDQHSFMQQLRDGKNDFFVTFIHTLKNRDASSMKVQEDMTAGDYLNAYWLGTRAALYEADRESITITLNSLSTRSVGVLIALFERAVSLYAELINVNAYHQPGVEAGKKAAGVVLSLQKKILQCLQTHQGSMMTANELSAAIDEINEVEAVHHLLQHLAANPDHKITKQDGAPPFESTYGLNNI